MDMEYKTPAKKIYEYIEQQSIGSVISNTTVREALGWDTKFRSNVSAALSHMAGLRMLEFQRKTDSGEYIYKKVADYKVPARNVTKPIERKPRKSNTNNKELEEAKKFFLDALDMYIETASKNALASATIDELLEEIKKRT